MHLERNLERALHRADPAPGLADRVLKRLEPAPPRQVRARRWQAVAAALVLVVLGGGWVARHEMERRAGERARDQALLALRIAGAKVRFAQEQVRGIGSHTNG